MFDKKEMREGLLQKLIDSLLGHKDEECDEMPEMVEGKEPKASIEVVKVEAKPKKKMV